ncbi:hypothetical protein M404DRAFT_449953 [Pisolithus tinctorius Marx 270]|uniref:Cyclin N-terminal domain-containing protein n=1 Tax=Pisolithus tinctorius Marx 270 TaxID=870435 RepID=A0A0C3JXP7_PISTI|nr:hypothetical protein M404DRAFT_449953 [Pisolithus tinctorius Marx 270]
MASVHGPIPPAHPSPYRVVHNASHPRIQYPQGVPSTKPPSVPRQDEYYGHAETSLLCTRFITHLFACPELPPSSSNSKVKLQKFIAYALHRTKLQPAVTFAALVLLQRLKARFPTARGSSGHRLFISAFMLASKVICDDTYSNKSWGIVAQGMFQLREINQMEREMCQYLEWELNVDPSTLPFKLHPAAPSPRPPPSIPPAVRVRPPAFICHPSRYPRGLSVLFYVVHLPCFLRTATNARRGRRPISQNRVRIVFAGILLDGARTDFIFEDKDVCVRVTRRLVNDNRLSTFILSILDLFPFVSMTTANILYTTLFPPRSRRDGDRERWYVMALFSCSLCARFLLCCAFLSASASSAFELTIRILTYNHCCFYIPHAIVYHWAYVQYEENKMLSNQLCFGFEFETALERISKNTCGRRSPLQRLLDTIR